MKTVVLIPVKNEEWILECTLQNTAPHVDAILIADQNSTDKTLEICARFPNVRVVNNPHEGHSNKVRWLLLDEARKLGSNNLIICIDADEMIAPKGIEEMKNLAAEGKAIAGDVFNFKWIQLWKGVHQYWDGDVWKDNNKNIAFIDNAGINEYKKEFVINDHTTRVPDTHIGKMLPVSYPLLHFHFVAWKRNQLKQAWYRCSELIAGARNARRINNTYRVTLEPKNIVLAAVPKPWTEGLILPQHLEAVSSPWHLEALRVFFDTHGIEFFEELQIWHIEELRTEFVKRTGREPMSKVYPQWLVSLNDIKNWIRNFRF